MKPEDLKRPFKWEARTPLLQDGIFYVPAFYENYAEFILPGFEDLFGNQKAVRLEYCSGNGAWIADCAFHDPESNWIAIEKRFDRVRKIWSKIKNLKLSNLLAVAGEGLTATEHYFKDESVDEIFINFPDPWPKKRHAKHRLVEPIFVEQMARILKPNAKVTIVTDDPDYSDIIVQEMNSAKGFVPNFGNPYFVLELEGYGTSYFDALWRKQGKQIRYHQWIKSGY